MIRRLCLFINKRTQAVRVARSYYPKAIASSLRSASSDDIVLVWAIPESVAAEALKCPEHKAKDELRRALAIQDLRGGWFLADDDRFGELTGLCVNLMFRCGETFNVGDTVEFSKWGGGTIRGQVVIVVPGFAEWPMTSGKSDWGIARSLHDLLRYLGLTDRLFAVGGLQRCGPEETAVVVCSETDKRGRHRVYWPHPKYIWKVTE